MPRRRAGVLLPLELKILEHGIALQGGGDPFYGFGIARELAAEDGGQLTSHGTLYKALNRMAASGMLESTWEDPAIAEGEGRPRRRLYRVTADGMRVLSAQPQPAAVATPAAARVRLA
ncbi:MAG: PadR family transcriptional regulator [Actinomycetota bacterium]|nr:PadR family transcriptional regulator [Actinomycetota bacterium]